MPPQTRRFTIRDLMPFGVTIAITLMTVWLITAWLNGCLWSGNIGRIVAGEILGALLVFLKYGHIVLYRRTSARRRVLSWVFIFLTDWMGTEIHPAEHHHEMAWARHAVFSALFASLVILISWYRHRREA